MQVNIITHPRAIVGDVDDIWNIVVDKSNRRSFVSYISDRVRYATRNDVGMFGSIDVGAVDTEPFITAKLGGSLIIQTPKWVAESDVTAFVWRAIGVTWVNYSLGYYHGDEEEREEKKGEESLL